MSAEALPDEPLPEADLESDPELEPEAELVPVAVAEELGISVEAALMAVVAVIGLWLVVVKEQARRMSLASGCVSLVLPLY